MGTEKQVKILVYVLIIILLVFGILIYAKEKLEEGYFYSNGESEFEIRPIKFHKLTTYQIKIFFPNNPTPYLIDLRYDPAKLEDISIDRSIKAKIADDKLIYITIDPEENLTGKTTVAALEIDKFIDNQFFYNIPVNSALTKSYNNMTVRTCEDAKDEMSIIWLKLGNQTKIYSEENCIIVQGTDQEELIRAADRLALYLVGIMK